MSRENVGLTVGAGRRNDDFKLCHERDLSPKRFYHETAGHGGEPMTGGEALQSEMPGPLHT